MREAYMCASVKYFIKQNSSFGEVKETNRKFKGSGNISVVLQINVCIL